MSTETTTTTVEIDRRDAERVAWGKSEVDNFGPSNYLRAKALNAVEKAVELAVAGKADAREYPAKGKEG